MCEKLSELNKNNLSYYCYFPIVLFILQSLKGLSFNELWGGVEREKERETSDKIEAVK